MANESQILNKLAPDHWEPWAAFFTTVFGILASFWPPAKRAILYVFHVAAAILTGPMKMKSVEAAIMRIEESLANAIWRIEDSLAVNMAISRMGVGDQIVFECDPSGLANWLSPAWCDATGLSLSESLGRGWVKGLALADQDRVLAHWLKCVAEQRPYEIQYKLRHAITKAEVLYVATASPVLSARDGKAIRYCGKLERVQ